MLLISIMDIDRSSHHSHAHALLRECLKPYGIAYNEDTPLIKSDMGKPSLAGHPEIHFNLSHANGIAACIVSGSECGIDCEKVRSFRENVVKRAFSEREKELIYSNPEENRDLLFFRMWTLKEAYVKALGVGISYPLSTTGFTFENGRIITDISGYRFRQYLIRGGEYVVSTCEKITDQI